MLLKWRNGIYKTAQLFSHHARSTFLEKSLKLCQVSYFASYFKFRETNYITNSLTKVTQITTDLKVYFNYQQHFFFFTLFHFLFTLHLFF